MSVSKCADCGRPEDDTENVTLLVRSVTLGARVIHFSTCDRCTLKRGIQDQAEMREQLERSMKKSKVA